MKIETGIPIPPARHGPISIAEKLERDQSVLCETEDRARALVSAIKKLGGSATRRKMADGYRVWRLD